MFSPKSSGTLNFLCQTTVSYWKMLELRSLIGGGGETVACAESRCVSETRNCCHLIFIWENENEGETHGTDDVR